MFKNYEKTKWQLLKYRLESNNNNSKPHNRSIKGIKWWKKEGKK